TSFSRDWSSDVCSSDLQLIKATKDSSESFQAAKQPLYFISFFIHFFVVLPRRHPIDFRGHDRSHTQVQNKLPGIITFVGLIHDHASSFTATVFQRFQQVTTFRGITCLPGDREKVTAVRSSAATM